MSHYIPPDAARWTGRVDDLEDRDSFRWHQVVERLDLSAPADQLAMQTPRGFCLLGYCCDQGVELNLGRVGAALGPQAIRSQLANLPVNFPMAIGLYDGGDVHCQDGDVEGTQKALAEAVKKVLSAGLFPVVLGGGHDVAFGHYLGIIEHLPPSTSLGILNFDAHLDLRPLRPAATSGTMFTQIAAATKGARHAIPPMLRFPNAESGTLSDPLRAPVFSTTRLLGARVGGAPYGLVLRRMDGLFWRSNARARDDLYFHEPHSPCVGK